MDFEASGIYSCEVSTVTPIFTKPSNDHELTVIRKCAVKAAPFITSPAPSSSFSSCSSSSTFSLFFSWPPSPPKPLVSLPPRPSPYLSISLVPHSDTIHDCLRTFPIGSHLAIMFLHFLISRTCISCSMLSNHPTEGLVRYVFVNVSLPYYSSGLFHIYYVGFLIQPIEFLVIPGVPYTTFINWAIYRVFHDFRA